VVPPAPTNTAPPTISGTAQQGKTLTESHGTWTGEPTGFTYQWLRCNGEGTGCAAITGATAQSYVLRAADVEHTLRVQETASNAGGAGAPATSEATSAVLPLPPENSSPPTISGTPQQGQTLTDVNGSWTNNPTAYTYQWLQCDSLGAGCQPITGATSQTYLVTRADVGHTLVVQETASNAGGTGAPAVSEPTPVILPAGGEPTSSSPPTITGSAKQGQTLTEHPGSWTGEPNEFAYRWLRCDGAGNGCQPITGATSQTYALVEADVGHTLRVTEEASNFFGTGAATSAATSAVAPLAPTNSSPPTITGSAQQGQTLTEHHGTWTGEPTSFAYQWVQCDEAGSNCSPISGATGATYVATSADVGHALRVQESASNAGGTGGPVSSAATAAVLPAAPENVTAPTISGTARQGQTLTENHGTWTNSPSAYAYQWLQCDSLGGACLPIAGAKSQTYVPAAGDVGHTLAVQETASNAGGSSAPATSASTAVVAAQQQEAATFGNATVGTSTVTSAANEKRVSRYALPVSGSVSKLSVYLAPTETSGQQVMEGVIYSDAGGAPQALLAVSQQLTFLSTNAAGWYDLAFATPVHLSAGSYWIGVLIGPSGKVAGFRYKTVAKSRDSNANKYAAGPSEPFGTPTVDGKQTSLFATYTPE
jgi:hypothetical protein